MLGVAMRTGRGNIYSHERPDSYRVLMWVKTADAENVKTDLP